MLYTEPEVLVTLIPLIASSTFDASVEVLNVSAANSRTRMPALASVRAALLEGTSVPNVQSAEFAVEAIDPPVNVVPSTFTDLCQKAHGFNRGMNGEKKCEQREL